MDKNEKGVMVGGVSNVDTGGQRWFDWPNNSEINYQTNEVEV